MSFVGVALSLFGPHFQGELQSSALTRIGRDSLSRSGGLRLARYPASIGNAVMKPNLGQTVIPRGFSTTSAS